MSLPKPELTEVEKHFLRRAQVVFHSYPELLSFSLEQDQAPAPAAPVYDPDEDEDEEMRAERFDLHVALSTDVSDDFQQEMCRAVTEFLTEMLQERPETLDILRGRTFARMLH
jgi:hypothetical protein